MMNKLICLCIILLTLPFVASAETFQISEQVSLNFAVPDGWKWVKTPPQELLEEMAEHIGHEAEEKGYSPSQGQLLDAARKRLKANEVLLYNHQSKAHMSLDLSRLRQGEKAPSKKSIKLSAKGAGESLEQEEGVTKHQGKSKEFKVDGAWYAYRYDADYMHHDEKMRFSGVIGFSSPYWFYFYYTDHLNDPDDRTKADQIFQSIRIVKTE
jgi:hypothetical protein